MDTPRRKYPIGTYTFEKFIEEGYSYIDKTDLVWKIAHEAKYIFLSRPRRFGKSLLTTTLKSYFEGRKDLFEGLKIMGMEKDWIAYPTFRFDLSGIKELPIGNMAYELRRSVAYYEKKYGFVSDAKDPGKALGLLINSIFDATGQKSVVILDEYDAPLLNYLDKPEPLEEVRRILKEFYTPLKESDACLHYVFITGITKFSQLSIFSTINNLINVSLMPEYAAICGLTEEEVYKAFPDEIAAIAREYEVSVEEARLKLKEQYDGYHFSDKSPDIYNPFSVLTAMADTKLGNYWFATGTPTFLLKQLDHFDVDMSDVDGQRCHSSDFDQPTENMQTIYPLLYQSGYLTIKDYDRSSEMYVLGIPNAEVRVGLMSNILPLKTGKNSVQNSNMAADLKLALCSDDIDKAMGVLKAYYAGIPYDEFWGGGKSLKDMTSKERLLLQQDSYNQGLSCRGGAMTREDFAGFLKRWMLVIGMVAGAGLYLVYHAIPALHPAGPFLLKFCKTIQPWLLFVMLFLSFCKIEPAQMRPHRWQASLLLVQGGLFAALVLVILWALHSDSAFAAALLGKRVMLEALMLCLICPTATACAVVTGKLGGDMAGAVTYTVFINLLVAVAVPLLVPLIYPAGMDFASAFARILSKVFPLLIMPCVCAWLVRWLLPGAHRFLLKYTHLSFYIWSFALTLAILMSTRSIVQYDGSLLVLLEIAAASLAACIFQFWAGKKIGERYGCKITAGQSLGQKNTVFAIWLGYTFLNPIVSVAGGFYSVWHNLYNTWQLNHHHRRR